MPLLNIRKFLGCVKGVALIEFAVFAPVLVTFFLGAADLTRYILIAYKVDRIASTSGNIIARMDVFAEARFTEIFAAAPQIASPFDFATKGKVILSGVKYDATLGKKITWVRTGGGSLVHTSQIGNLNGAATFPTAFTMTTGELVVVAEVYYQFEAMFMSVFLPNEVLRRVAYFRANPGLF